MTKLATAVLALVVVAFGAAHLTSAEEPAILRIVPESQHVESWEGDITVSVEISNLDHHAVVPVDDNRDTVPDRDVTSEGLGAFGFEFVYDPTILSFHQRDFTTFLGDMAEVICTVRDVDPWWRPGRIPVGCARLDSPGPQDSGTLTTLTFRPLAPGTTKLELFGAQLAGPLGEEIPVSTELASITIEPSEERPAVLRLTPSQLIAAEGGPLTSVSVEIEDLTHYGLSPVDRDRDGIVDFYTVSDGLGAFQFTFLYDPSIVEIVDYKERDFLASTGRVPTCFVREEPGEFTFGCVSSLPDGLQRQGPQGTGTLATLLLRPLAPGISQLTLTNTKLADPSGQSIPVTAQSGLIEVAEILAPAHTPLPVLPAAGSATPHSENGALPVFVLIVGFSAAALLVAHSKRS